MSLDYFLMIDLKHFVYFLRLLIYPANFMLQLHNIIRACSVGCACDKRY